MPESTVHLYDLERPALAALLETWGQPAYRARQVWEWLSGSSPFILITISMPPHSLAGLEEQSGLGSVLPLLS